MATKTLQERVKEIASGRGSRTQRLEDLCYILGLPVADALQALEIYKPVKKQHTPKDVTFGVEIECYDIVKLSLTEAVGAKGVSIQCEGYNHRDNDRYYKIVNDGSINGYNSAEIVSPILKGKEGMKSLKTVCDTLCELGAKVNRSCGLHVHLDAKGMDIKHWRNLYINYARLENIIDSFMPRSRRGNNNGFCRSIALYPRLETIIMQCNSVEDIVNYFRSRYFKINVEAFRRHGTVEFRHHGGTVEFEKVSMWVNFLQKLLAYSKNNTVENCATIEDVPFLTEKEKRYFRQRITTLAAR